MIIRHNRDIQEYGVGKERGTVVLDKPHVLEVLQEMRKQYVKTSLKVPFITVNIGASFANPKDSFNKKLGVEIAKLRMKPILCSIKVSAVNQNMSDALYLVLEGVDDQRQVRYEINIKIYRDSGELRVMDIYTRSFVE